MSAGGHDPEQRHAGAPPPPGADAHDLAAMLDPVLHEVAGGRLGPIEWFRSAFQRGGAATGFSTWRRDDGASVGVLVKFPIGPVEQRWTAALGACGADAWEERWARALPTPRVLASGRELGGYDLAWIIAERLSGPMVAAAADEASMTDLLRAAADFQALAMKAEPLGPRPARPDWERAVTRSREIAKAGGIPEPQRWNEALRKVQRALGVLVARWEARPMNAWCHGDLHPGNALRRAGGGEPGGWVLIDLALVHTGHWVEDALYLERQFWGREKGLCGVKPVPTLARLRRERGLPADDDYGLLGMVKRVLTAACAPVLLDREGNPAYLHAALETIDRCLPQAAR